MKPHLTFASFFVGFLLSVTASVCFAAPISLDRDADGFIDAIELKYGGLQDVSDPQLVPAHGSAVMLGTTTSWPDFTRFPETDMAVAIAAGGVAGAEFALVLNGDGRVFDWSGQGDTIRQNLSSSQWQGTDPLTWRGIVSIEVAPFGVFGVNANGEVHFAAEPWAVTALQGVSNVGDIDTSYDSLIVVTSGGDISTATSGWTTPAEAAVPDLINDQDFEGQAIRVAAGKGIFAVVSHTGAFRLWGTAAALTAMDSASFAALTVTDFELSPSDYSGVVLSVAPSSSSLFGADHSGALGASVVQNVAKTPAIGGAFSSLRGGGLLYTAASFNSDEISAPAGWKFIDIASTASAMFGITRAGTALEWAFADQLGVSEPRQLDASDWENLTALDLERSPVMHLDGIEEARNLRELSIEHSWIEDLGPLAALRLEWLSLQRMPLFDISLLKSFGIAPVHLSMYDLALDEVLSGALDTTAGFDHRREAAFWMPRAGAAPVPSSTPYSWKHHFEPELAALIEGEISSNHLEAVLEVRQLDVAAIPGLQLQRMEGLSLLANLESLNVSGQQIVELSELADLPHLQVIDLSDTPVAELSPLLSLKALQEVNLSDTGVAELLDPSADMPAAERQREIVRDLQRRGVNVVVGSASARDDWHLHFEAALAALVRDKLSISGEALTLADLEALTSLAADRRSPPHPFIENLSGLQYTWRLQSLTLFNQGVTDLTPLRALTRLSHFSVVFSSDEFGAVSGDSRLKDLSPLAGHPSLERVSLPGSHVLDLSPLYDLPLLERVVLFNTFAADLLLYADAEHPRAKTLRADVALLESAKVDVSYGGEPRDDWYWLFNPALRRSLASKFLAGMSLRDLQDLSTLDLSNQGLDDLTNIDLMYQLESLDVSGNYLTDLTPLSELAQLTSLDVNDNPVADLSPVLELDTLQNLNASETFAAELYAAYDTFGYSRSVAWSTYRELEILMQEGSIYLEILLGVEPRNDWWAVGHSDLATHLVNEFGRVPYALQLSDLQGEFLFDVRHDDLRPISSLEGIQYLLSLEDLYLRQQAIEDLSPLAHLGNLQNVNLGNDERAQWPVNAISDLAPLIGLYELDELYLDRTDVLDLAPLLDFRSPPNLINVDGTFAAELLLHAGGSLNPRAVRQAEIAQRLSLSPSAEVRQDWWRVFDPALGDALAAEFGALTDLWLIDLLDLRDFSAPEAGIVSLENIDLADGLVTLELSSNPLEDLSPLSGSNRLHYLDLAWCSQFRGELFHIEPLASIRSLQTLDLRQNYLLDIEPLLSLPVLQSVNLSDTYVDADPQNPAHWIYKVLEARGVSVTSSQTLDDWSFLFDPGLATALTRRLGDNFDLNDLQQMDSLDASEFGIRSLDGLEICQNLETLYLRNNQIEDLSPLEAIAGLTFLDLSVDLKDYPDGNSFKDLAPLANLWSLEFLGLSGCGATDFSVIGALPSLQQVELFDTLVVPDDLMVTRLQSAGVNVLLGGSIPFERILAPSLYHAIQAQGSLQIDIADLNLSGANVTSLGGIGIFRELELLDLRDNRIQDISPLAGLPDLFEINLDNEYFQNGGLWRADGTYNAVSDISVLATLPSLESFRARGNHISDIAPLLKCSNLQQVELGDNFLLIDQYNSDCPDWINLQRLGARGLYLGERTDRLDWYRMFPDPTLSRYFEGPDGQGMRDYQLMQINHIDLSDPVFDLTGVEELFNLVELSLTNAYVEDLSSLSGLNQLYDLTLSREAMDDVLLLKDLSPLAGLPALEWLDFTNQGIREIEVLRDLPSLQGIDLAGNYLDTRPDRAVDRVIQDLPRVGFSIGQQRNLWDAIADAGLERAIRDRLGLSPFQQISQSDWANLGSLYADGYGIEDISELVLAGDLSALELAGNRISDVSALSELEYLASVDLSNDSNRYPNMENQVSDLSVFSEMESLNGLSLTGNLIADVSPLLNMRSLGSLQLDGNPLDLREGSDTVRLLEALIARGTNVWYDDRYRTGLAEGEDAVQSNPQAYSLFTENQLRALALGTPTLEQADGQFQLQLDVYESINLIDWLPGQGSFEELEGQLIWKPANPGTTKFYTIEAR